MSNSVYDEPVRVSKLQLRCMEFGLPQYMIAVMAGMSPSQLSSTIHGRKQLSEYHITRLCELFNCTPDDILGHEESVVVWQ